jgi:hypothetical protein
MVERDKEKYDLEVMKNRNRINRLTRLESSGYGLIKMNDEWCNLYCESQPVEHCNSCAIYEAVQRLGELEDEIERLHKN